MTRQRTTRAGALYNDRRAPLSPRELAELRMVTACRSCSAMLAEDPDGRVRIAHRPGCSGVVDKQDAGSVTRRECRSVRGRPSGNTEGEIDAQPRASGSNASVTIPGPTRSTSRETTT